MIQVHGLLTKNSCLNLLFIFPMDRKIYRFSEITDKQNIDL